MSGSTDPAVAPSEASRPLLRVVRGTPDEAELAAVTAVLLARSGGAEDPAPDASTTGGWRERSRMMRTPLRAAPGGWRGSRTAR